MGIGQEASYCQMDLAVVHEAFPLSSPFSFNSQVSSPNTQDELAGVAERSTALHHLVAVILSLRRSLGKILDEGFGFHWSDELEGAQYAYDRKEIELQVPAAQRVALL